MKERFGTLRWRQNLRTGEKRFRPARLSAERECCRKASPAKWRLDDGVSVTAVTRE